jgi:hypothetical protein
MTIVPKYLPAFEEMPRRDHLLSRSGVTARCYTYQVWDTMNRLCYVGMTHNFQTRWKQHERKSWWLGEINVAYIELQGWATTDEAHMDEAVVIWDQNPVYNTSTESFWLARYQREIERSDTFGAPVSRRVFRPICKLAVV